MMKQELQDKGLRKAIQESTPYRLSSNFTFRTMLKVEESVRLQEKKQERRLLFATIAASVCLLVGSVITLSIFLGEEMIAMFSGLGTTFARMDLFSSPYWVLSIFIFILIGFDYWMRRAYYKQHPGNGCKE